MVKNTNKRKTRTALMKSIRKTLKSRQKSVIVQKFMELLTMIKLYHWKTYSYSQHKATDELYGKLNENIDRFVEVLLGKSKQRIHMLENKMRLYDLDTKQELREHVLEYRDFLVNMDQVFNEKRDSDLFSIRDDLLADLNQFLYLWTFDQP
jgi:DNA-binding ferritin-like protein